MQLGDRPFHLMTIEGENCSPSLGETSVYYNHRLAAVAASIVLASAASAVTVTPSNPDGWQPANVRSDATVGITDTYKPVGEQGSLQFTTNTVTNGQDKADYVKYWGVKEGRTLGNISNVGYDWYRDSSSTTAQHFAPALRLAYQTSGGQTGYLIYENVYNGGSTSTPVATDTWVDASITNANFWMRAFGPGRTIEKYDVTLAQWASGYTYGTSQPLDANTSIIGIEVGVGSGWGGTFSGAVDDVRLSFGRDTIAANFEPDTTAAVPEPASWAMMVGGFGVVGGTMRRRRRTRISFG